MIISQRHYSMVSPKSIAFEPKGCWVGSFPPRFFVNLESKVLSAYLRKKARNMIIGNLAGCAALLKGPIISLLLLANLSSPAVGYQTIAFAASDSFHSCIARTKGITAEIQTCQANEYARLDQQLNQTYKNIMAQLGTKKLRIRLVQSQKVWIWRRDEDCRTKIQASVINGGSAADLVFHDCRIKMVRDRIHWLKKVPRNPGYLSKV